MLCQSRMQGRRWKDGGQIPLLDSGGTQSVDRPVRQRPAHPSSSRERRFYDGRQDNQVAFQNKIDFLVKKINGLEYSSSNLIRQAVSELQILEMAYFCQSRWSLPDPFETVIALSSKVRSAAIVEVQSVCGERPMFGQSRHSDFSKCVRSGSGACLLSKIQNRHF